MTLIADELSAPVSAGPQGEAEDWDEELLLLLLLLLLSDAARATALWDTLMPVQYRGWLEAVPIDDVRAYVASGGRLPPAWFDVETQRYGLGSRGFIAQAGIVAALEAFREAAQDQARQQAAGLFAGGEISTWQRSFSEQLKLIALAAALFAIGGTGRLTDTVLSSTSKPLRFQFTRLLRFARQIQAGVVTAAEAIRRAAAYPSSTITDIYHETRRRAHIAVGYRVERNILDPHADHCQFRAGDVRPNCPDITSRGWVKINTLPRIGARKCLWNCRCHWSFSRIP